MTLLPEDWKIFQVAQLKVRLTAASETEKRAPVVWSKQELKDINEYLDDKTDYLAFKSTLTFKRVKKAFKDDLGSGVSGEEYDIFDLLDALRDSGDLNYNTDWMKNYPWLKGTDKKWVAEYQHTPESLARIKGWEASTKEKDGKPAVNPFNKAKEPELHAAWARGFNSYKRKLRRF